MHTHFDAHAWPTLAEILRTQLWRRQIYLVHKKCVLRQQYQAGEIDRVNYNSAEAGLFFPGADITMII